MTHVERTLGSGEPGAERSGAVAAVDAVVGRPASCEVVVNEAGRGEMPGRDIPGGEISGGESAGTEATEV